LHKITQPDNIAKKEKHIYRFNFTNNYIKKFGERNGEKFKLNPSGRKILNCDPSIWQYIIGIPEVEFEIELEQDCIANASTKKHDQKTCLPAYPSPTNLKKLLFANYFLFPENVKNDLGTIFDLLDRFERYLFISQKLSLRNLLTTDLDEMATNYQENPEEGPTAVKAYLNNIIEIVKQQYDRNTFLYKGLNLISLVTGLGSFFVMYCYAVNSQINTASTLTTIIAGFFIAYTHQLMTNTDKTCNEINNSIEKIKKIYEIKK
jgi:hypothetical protein